MHRLAFVCAVILVLSFAGGPAALAADQFVLLSASSQFETAQVGQAFSENIAVAVVELTNFSMRVRALGGRLHDAWRLVDDPPVSRRCGAFSWRRLVDRVRGDRASSGRHRRRIWWLRHAAQSSQQMKVKGVAGRRRGVVVEVVRMNGRNVCTPAQLGDQVLDTASWMWSTLAAEHGADGWPARSPCPAR